MTRDADFFVMQPFFCIIGAFVDTFFIVITPGI